MPHVLPFLPVYIVSLFSLSLCCCCCHRNVPYALSSSLSVPITQPYNCHTGPLICLFRVVILKYTYNSHWLNRNSDCLLREMAKTKKQMPHYFAPFWNGVNMISRTQYLHFAEIFCIICLITIIIYYYCYYYTRYLNTLHSTFYIYHRGISQFP